MTTELMEAIISSYNDDTDESNELISKIALFLYHNTTDDQLQLACVKVMTDLERCVTCGDKLVEYPYREWHSEIGQDELRFDTICLRCDRKNMEDLI